MDSPEEDNIPVPCSPGVAKEHGSGPSLAMRTVMSGIRSSFPTVQQLSTSTLFNLMSEKPRRPSHGLMILDTREESEYNVSHLPGAVWLDPATADGELAAFARSLPSRFPRDCTSLDLVCYCSVGYRSSKMAAQLEEILKCPAPASSPAPSTCGSGLAAGCGKGAGGPGGAGHASAAKLVAVDINVFNLEGSVFQWANESRRLVDATGVNETRHVHPYSAVWGRLVDATRRKWP